MDSPLPDLRVPMDRQALWPDRSGRAVIACSGGADSVVLARLLAPLLQGRGHAVTLACLDHGWRQDATVDVALVSALAQDLGADFATARRPAPAPLVSELGREGAARAVRRAWLASLARGPSDRVYLGHQRDDQLETVLLRREQGVAPERAAVMPWRDGCWCRPLLDRTRAGLRALAARQGWAWRDDPSNEDETLDRNRIRRRALPSLSELEAERLLRQGWLARLRIDALRLEADRLRGEVLRTEEPGACSLDRAALSAAPREVALLLLRLVCGGDRTRGGAALQARLDDCSPGGPARVRHLGGGWTGRVAGDRLELSLGELELEGEPPPSATLRPGETLTWPGGWTLGCRSVDAGEARRHLAAPDAGRSFAAFDPDALAGPVSVRAAGSGLRIRPFGLNGTSSVRDLLAEAGVPRPQRAAWPVLVDDAGEVLWLPGVRASATAPVAGSGAAIILYTVAGPPSTGASASTPGTP